MYGGIYHEKEQNELNEFLKTAVVLVPENREEVLEEITIIRIMLGAVDSRLTVTRRQRKLLTARAERAERSALKSYFQQQGMSEEQVNQAITDYKAQQKKNQPNIEQMQQERDAALKEAQQMKQEKFLSGKGVKAEDVDYVMFKVSKLVDDKTTFEKAAEKYLKENPRFVGGSSYRVSTSTGSDSNGSGGNVNASINDAIRAAARR